MDGDLEEPVRLPRVGELVRVGPACEWGAFAESAWLRVGSVRPAWWADGWVYVEGVVLTRDGSPAMPAAALVRLAGLEYYPDPR